MAYSNYQNQNQQYYPNNYQNQNQYLNASQYLQNQNYNVQPNQQIIWVQGEAEAKNYLIAPNTTIPLWDTEEHKIYLKSSDSAGMPSIKVLEYTVRENKTNPLISSEHSREEEVSYVKVEDFKKLQKELETLKAEIEDKNNNYRKRGKQTK